MTGYVAYLLYLHNQAVNFDVVVGEILQSLWDNLDSVALAEAKEPTIEAISWLLRTLGITTTKK